ncbi:proline-rich protein 22 [Falco cherrug]|uniref:proline-rich protein 22 n=1 Tax=Falco cherrug TaxID=345164 RepID=UPI00247A5705|nr:proline-rich protein 22 [Falco cherrug]
MTKCAVLLNQTIEVDFVDVNARCPIDLVYKKQPPPAAWAPEVPLEPPAGLQRAPCGCYFDPRFFHLQWTSSILPPPVTAIANYSSTSLLGEDSYDVPEEVLLQEALRLFGLSSDTAGHIQEGPSSVPTPGDTSPAVPCCDLSSLALPEDLFDGDYSVSEMTDSLVSLEVFNTIEMEPQELWGDMDWDLSPSPPAAP